jgi:hypothetical protein
MGIEKRNIDDLMAGKKKFHELCGSTSEMIAVFLAVGRFEELPPPYQEAEDAWDRLDTRQRNIVREYNRTFRAEDWDRPSAYDPLFNHNDERGIG